MGRSVGEKLNVPPCYVYEKGDHQFSSEDNDQPGEQLDRPYRQGRMVRISIETRAG